MPFSSSTDDTLPRYIRNKPASIRIKWISIFNRVFSEQGEEMAFIIANTWLKNNSTRSSLEARTENSRKIEVLKFKTAEGQLVKRTKDGQDYVDFILTGIDSDDGYTPELLQFWVDQINKGESKIMGDIDHEEYDKIVESTNSAEQAAELIKKTKKGLAKGVKAMYENGKMWVRALLDKRYKKHIEKAKGVSLEAFLDRDTSGNLTKDSELLGFTFAVEQNPAYSGAVIV